MKTAQKTIGFVIALGFIALIVFSLLKNKKQRNDELAGMLDFEEIVPVEVAQVRLVNVSPEMRETGTFVSSSDVLVISETQGKVLQLVCKVGDRVNAGQILAVVEKEVLESQFKLAKENLAKAEKDLDRCRNLHGGEAITGQQLEAAGLARLSALTELTTIGKQLQNTVVKAPISGVISNRLTDNGTYLTPGMHVFTISNQNHMNFRAKLAGSDLAELSPGLSVRLIADALPDQIFHGKVKTIGVVSDLSGRYEVEIEVSNREGFIRSGMTGVANFIFSEQKSRMVIPRASIVGSIFDASVFVVEGDTVLERKINVELLENNLVAVTSGLQPGENVVISGQINLAHGSPVDVKQAK